MDKEELAKRLVGWIKEHILGAGCRGVVLGMSGGLDSSVVAVLCKHAFPQTTLGIIMPCYSIDKDKEHAEAVAEQFSIPVKTVNLDKVYDTFMDVLPDEKTEPALRRLAHANLKARLRMVTLYNIANQRKYMVAGSSNRGEITTGYFTKYGDGGVDIMPLGNLVKSEVVGLAHSLKIPREIIVKPPSAGLWEGQTDEAEMGLTYEALDRYILTGDAPEELKKKIDAMKSAATHKRNMPPVPPF
jgi:NAD+ synthase